MKKVNSKYSNLLSSRETQARYREEVARYAVSVAESQVKDGSYASNQGQIDSIVGTEWGWFSEHSEDLPKGDQAQMFEAQSLFKETFRVAYWNHILREALAYTKDEEDFWSTYSG